MKKILILLLGLSLYACSSTQEVQKSEEEKGSENVYVFDSVSANADSVAAQASVAVQDTTNIPAQNLNSVLKKNVKYFVQIGAFTTKARAERFVKLNEDKITFPMEISFNDKVKLFVVRLPYFRNRQEAEKVRDALWQTKEFKDAFIVTVIK